MFNLAQTELAPKAAEIDQKNQFKEIRVSKTFFIFYWCSK